DFTDKEGTCSEAILGLDTPFEASLARIRSSLLLKTASFGAPRTRTDPTTPQQYKRLFDPKQRFGWPEQPASPAESFAHPTGDLAHWRKSSGSRGGSIPRNVLAAATAKEAGSAPANYGDGSGSPPG